MYTEIIERLFNAARHRGMDLNLETACRLSELLDHPHRSYKTIHVAGTNGKGSVATKIAKALECAGFRTGLYTSPHLSSFRERIAIHGQLISEEAIVEGMTALFSLSDKAGLDPTFFEWTTFLAFDYFRKQKVDVAVIETGLGGRLDATNVICPILSVITSIDREHTQFLGETREQIALEKAGILKSHIPAVLGPKACLNAILKKAEELNCPLHIAQEKEGFYDKENSAIARKALEVLSISSEAIEKGLCFRPPCRFERIGHALLDVAHNPQGFARLFEAINLEYPDMPLRVLVGMSKDKDISACFKVAASRALHMHLVEADTPRAATVKELEDILRDYDYANYTSHESVLLGVAEALALAEKNQELLVICGSFFIMSRAREALGCQAVKDPLDLNEKILSSRGSLS